MYNFTNDKQKIVFYDAFKGFLLDGTICAIQLVFILRKKKQIRSWQRTMNTYLNAIEL